MDDTDTLLHWISMWRNTRIADYDNAYERSACRNWAEYIISKGC